MSALTGLPEEVRYEIEEEIKARHLRRDLVQHGLQKLLLRSLEKEIILPNPSAGVDFSTIVPAGVVWDVLSVLAVFTASAVVATRFIDLRTANQDGSIITRSSAGATVAATGTIGQQWAINAGDHGFNSGAVVAALLIPGALGSGYTIKSSTSNIDVGDQWSAIRLVVREWSPARVVHAADAILRDLDSAGGID